MKHLLAAVLMPLALASSAYAQGPPALGGPLPPVRAPRGNPITLPKTLLGKTLFWDEQLSSTRSMSCGTCHIPGAGSSDPRAMGRGALHPGADGSFGTPDDVLGSPGVPRTSSDGSYLRDVIFGLRPQVTERRSMPILNAAFVPELMWDGRAPGTFLDPETGAVLLNRNAALESQALLPVVSEVEMGHMGIDFSDVEARIEHSTPLHLASDVPTRLVNWIAGRSYPELFEEVFGDEGISAVRFALAVATYERTLVADQTPLRDFASGDMRALTPRERNGRQVFVSKGCATCHGGPELSFNGFRYTGVRPPAEDLGRFNVTGRPGDRGRMKVPSLLNVGLRAPYFHDGSKATIAEVVDFYDRGGDFSAPNLAPQMVPLNLTPMERRDLIAFLGRPLIDPRVAREQAPFDRPSLYSESASVPKHFGAGSASGRGRVPRMVALEPAKYGNPSMTLAIGNARPAGLAVLLFGEAGDLAGSARFGVNIHVDLRHPFQASMIRLMGSGAGGGFGSLSFSLPNELSLVGVQRFAQWVVLGPGELNLSAATDAVMLTGF